MSQQNFFRRMRCGPRSTTIWYALGLTLLSASLSTGQASADVKPGSAGTCVSDKGSIVRRTGPDHEWNIVSQNEALPSGELLVYEDSGGALAIAANGGSAADLLQVNAGAEILVRPA